MKYTQNIYKIYCCVADQFRLSLSPPNNHLSPFQVTEGHCWTRGDENDDDVMMMMMHHR